MASRVKSLGEADVVARGRAYLETLVGRRVAVVGLGRSGLASARLLRAAGARVIASDQKTLAALGAETRALSALGVSLLVGGSHPEATQGADLVVVSPGVPLDSPQVAPAVAEGIPIIGELELGWRVMEADTIAITGTNGKTTTTALTGALLAEQARAVLVGGNIGTPLAAHALTFAADGLVVCEASSFQLETTEAFHPRVAAVLNVTPDHLDRHGSFEAYVDAKARIFLNQTPPIAPCSTPTTRAPPRWRPGRRRASSGSAGGASSSTESSCRATGWRRSSTATSSGSVPSARSSCAVPTTWRTCWRRRPACCGRASRPRPSAAASQASAACPIASSSSGTSRACTTTTIPRAPTSPPPSRRSRASAGGSS